MISILEVLGYNVSGGKFVSAKGREIDITAQADIYLNAKKPDDFELCQVPLLCLQGCEEMGA